MKTNTYAHRSRLHITWNRLAAAAVTRAKKRRNRTLHCIPWGFHRYRYTNYTHLVSPWGFDIQKQFIRGKEAVTGLVDFYTLAASETIPDFFV